MKYFMRSLTSVLLTATVVVTPLLAYADNSAEMSAPMTAVSTATATAAQAECSISNGLTLGSSGSDVVCLQQHLIDGGLLSLSTPTGHFGPMTKAAVVKWQQKMGITPTGFFGTLSRAAFSDRAMTSTGIDAHPAYKALEDMHRAMIAALMSTSSTASMDMMSAPDTRKIIAVMLYDQFEPLDAIGPLEVLGQMPDYRVVTVAKEKGPIASAFGTKIEADYSFDELKNPAIVVVPGGMFGTIAASKDPATLAWLKEADKTSEYTTSVCTGAWILGAAGFLNGRQASTHWTGADYLEDFGAQYTGKRYTVDGKYVTAAGVSAGIDMSLKLISMLEGDDEAKIAQLGLEYDPQPPFDAGSPAKADPVLVKMMRDMMKDHMMVAKMMYGTSTATTMTMQMDATSSAMEMEAYNVPASVPAPTIAVSATPDPMGGYNLHITTTNFTFTPQSSGKENVPGQGHGHVLVDGTKIGRAYSEWYYVGALPTGSHIITVELETNDHRDYIVNGTQVAAITTVM